MVVWVQNFHNGANSLPLQTLKGLVYGEIPSNTSFYVYIKIEENTATKMIAECTVYDENGSVFLITKGAGLTISPELKW
jgi:hypothetical protein